MTKGPNYVTVNDVNEEIIPIETDFTHTRGKRARLAGCGGSPKSSSSSTRKSMRALTRAHPQHHQDFTGNEGAKLSNTTLAFFARQNYAQPTKDTHSGLKIATGPITCQKARS